MKKIFLKAEWNNLIMANYEVPQELLLPYLPEFTELDLFNGKCYVSLVGFMFENTKVLGVKIPFHINFEEVNLRFYVKHKHGDEWRRGVVFIKEIVSKSAITFVANKLYSENYATHPMAHYTSTEGTNTTIGYVWECKQEVNEIKFVTNNKKRVLVAGSNEEFITEHYWGYSKGKAHTVEYAVEHPPWNIFECIDHKVNCAFGNVYGKKFEFLEKQEPSSVFMAEGSEIIVRKGTKIV
ncbi:MAG: DUF2071 domain-containing protein [Bacteroidota bacterium]|nr:DUF2071 domain-containing protein [Bacteroidota bacterium]